MALTNGWTTRIEEQIATLGDEAKCFVWMHSEAQAQNSRIDRIFVNTVIVCNTVIGVLSLLADGASWGSPQLLGVGSIFLSMLGAFQSKWDYAEKANKHKNLAAQWTQLETKITRELSLEVQLRKHSNEFVQMIFEDAMKLEADGNYLLPESIRTKCFEKYKNVPNFKTPTICGFVEHTRNYWGWGSTTALNEVQATC
jgi:hypothetical protein